MELQSYAFLHGDFATQFISANTTVTAVLAHKVLRTRVVCGAGWEYTVEATLGGYGPVEKRYHMCRRRRWVRMRKVVKNVKLQAAEVRCFGNSCLQRDKRTENCVGQLPEGTF